MTDTTTPVPPNWIAVRMDVSAHCTPEFLERVGGPIYDVYLLDTTEVTYCCSATAMHACYFVGSVVGHEIEDDQRREEVYDLLLETDANSEPVTYYTREDIRRVSAENVSKLGAFESADEAIEHYNGNPSF